MKKPLFSPHHASDAEVKASSEGALSPCVEAAAYWALPRRVRELYRPVPRRYERLPMMAIVFYALAGVCLGLYIAMSLSVSFADWFNDSVSAPVRAVMASLTSWVPFSVAELLLFSLPLILFLVLRHAIRRRCDTWRTALIFVGILCSVVALLFSFFVLTFAAGYRGRTVGDKLGLSDEPVSAEELYETALLLRERVNRETDDILFYTEDFSIMPHTFDELGERIGEAFERFSEDRGVAPVMDSRPKPVLLSEGMSYMGITGLYAFFTGEANINVSFPDYTLPMTVAHEMAHQRGIAREDEANFMAFLVCIGSEDPYVRYSGYLEAFEYVLNALYRADPDLYYAAYGGLNDEVKGELAAYSRFYKEYAGTVAEKISTTVNDTYLQSQGTPGVTSYGMVVDLIVAFYRD